MTTAPNLKRHKLKFYFVYRNAMLKRGSTAMRAQQLCNIANRYLGENVDFEILRIPSKPILQKIWATTRRSGGIYFFTKSATQIFQHENAKTLSAKSQAICYDHVDERQESLNLTGADFHICCSHAQLDAFKAKFLKRPEASGRAHLILHNTDIRLESLTFNSLASFKPLYMGTIGAAFLPEKIASELEIIPTPSTAAFEQSFTRLPQFNFHYGIRATRFETHGRIKPFTKGFTAAVCRSNILAHIDTDDALEFLGDDYPYLARHHDEDEIHEIIRRAKSGFGRSDWKKGMDIMKTVADRVSPKAIAGQIEALIKEASS